MLHERTGGSRLMPFTEHVKMIIFDDDHGIPRVILTLNNGANQVWLWENGNWEEVN